jgi:retron-type reverse transcriptase
MGLRQGRHRVVDVDLSRYFDTIRHDRILAKVAGRVVDGDVLSLIAGNRAQTLGARFYAAAESSPPARAPSLTTC